MVDARAAILDAAFEALTRDGATLPAADVARRAGVSKALVFHHFGSREGLLDAMAARVLAQTQEGLTRLAEEHPNPRARLVALARTLLEEPADAPEVARRVLSFWLLGNRARLRDDLIADFVRATLREAPERARVDPDAIARLILARWHGATLLYATGRSLDFEREAARVAGEVEGALS